MGIPANLEQERELLEQLELRDRLEPRLHRRRIYTYIYIHAYMHTYIHTGRFEPRLHRRLVRSERGRALRRSGGTHG